MSITEMEPKELELDAFKSLCFCNVHSDAHDPNKSDK